MFFLSFLWLGAECGDWEGWKEDMGIETTYFLILSFSLLSPISPLGLAIAFWTEEKRSFQGGE